MICARCNKFYWKEAYYNKHISKGDCIKKVDNDTSFLEIENHIKEVVQKKPKKETAEILDQNLDEIILKVFKQEKNEEIDELKSKIDLLTIEFNILKERVKMLEKVELPKVESQDEEKEQEEECIKAVKRERMNLSDEIVKEHLRNKTLDSDCELLYKYYFENVKKSLYPIKINKGKKNELFFWNGTDWMEDTNGNNLKNIFVTNLRKTYTKINDSSDPEYLNNQQYINDLSSKKNPSHLFNTFIESYLVV